MDRKKAALELLRTSKEMYTLLSGCTGLPHVECDPETYDDQILLFLREEDAKRKGMALVGEKNPVRPIRVEQKSFLPFYTSLYPMGVNCIVLNAGQPDCISVQLEELIRRERPQELPEGQVWVENPELHLTAIYFTQGIYRSQGKMTEELQELHEEMIAHFGKGRYIFPAGEEGKGIPLVKGRDGRLCQPLFTDAREFQKFNKSGQFRAMVVEAEKIGNLLTEESEGVVVNPLGVNVQFQLMKKTR